MKIELSRHMTTNNKLWPNKYQVTRCLDGIMFEIDDQTMQHDALYEFRINVVDLCIFRNRQFNVYFFEQTETLCMIADELLPHTYENRSLAAITT